MSTDFARAGTAILDGEGFLDGSPSPHVFFGASARSDCGMIRPMVAAIFEASMTREQAERLAGLMREHLPLRPEGVLTAALEFDGGVGRLTAYWRDRETLDAYLATGAVPRGTELMREVGAEPTLRIADVLQLG